MTAYAPLFAATDEETLISLALALGADCAGGPLSSKESELVQAASLRRPPPAEVVLRTRAAILDGSDPLGEALSAIRPPTTRRPLGAFYTDFEIVDAMVGWALTYEPARVVDAGCGSGRFLMRVLQHDPAIEVVGIDIDPVATLLSRAVVAVLDADAQILNADFVGTELAPIKGRTAFVGNPPYVRHHSLGTEAKRRAQALGELLGVSVSSLAGLHAHFYLATAAHARIGDIGCYITSSEWLDVNYGFVVRTLLSNGLGVRSIELFDPKSSAFTEAMTTAVITCFEVGSIHPFIRTRAIAKDEAVAPLGAGADVPRDLFERGKRWSHLIRRGEDCRNASGSRLGDVAKVHRGVATGANDYFVLKKPDAQQLGIDAWCVPVISSGKEIIESGGIIRDCPERKVILAVLSNPDRGSDEKLEEYLRAGERRHNGQPAVCERYLARHRRPWWNLGIPKPPPIVATYMARQPPSFAYNADQLLITNIALGIYPEFRMSESELLELVTQLNRRRQEFAGLGRTYQGGLEKFEPKEMEDLPIEWCGAS